MKKQSKVLKKAEQAIASGRLGQAIDYLNELLQQEPDNMSYLMLRGEAHLRMENYEAGLVDYAKVVEADNKNTTALVNFAAALIRCNRQNDAKEILEYTLELAPDNFDAHINLCNIYQSLGKPEESLKIAFKAIELRPGSCIAHNNFGTALGDLGLVAESREAFITANMLDSSFVPTIINLAQIEIKLENYREGIRLYENALTLKNITSNQSELIKYYLSYSYLYYGELAKGWDHYEFGFGPLLPTAALRSLRKFRQPKWNGEEIKGRKLLIWREQGLGDEIEFSTCLHDLVDLGIDVILETDPRLISIFQRTFPSFTVRPEMIDGDRFSALNDFDYHCSIASLPRLFRRDIKDFDKQHPAWVVDAARAQDVEAKLAPYKDKLLIGICWRSGIFSIQRNLNYTHLSDWKELLTKENIQFVNLQYGDCEAELREVEQALGVSILRWPDIDLKNDLESVIALIQQLNCVTTVGTAVSSLAAATGVTTFLLSKKVWLMLGEESRYPWFDCVIPLIAEPGVHVAEKIKLIPELLQSI